MLWMILISVNAIEVMCLPLIAHLLHVCGQLQPSWAQLARQSSHNSSITACSHARLQYEHSFICALITP